MSRRMLLLIVIACLAVDFSNPMMLGAFRFDPDESTEAIRAGSVAVPAPSAATLPAATAARRESNVRMPRLTPRPSSSRAERRTFAYRRAHLLAATPPSPSEDH